MALSTNFSRLQQLADEHLRFRVNQTDSADTVEIYKEQLYKRGHTEDELFFQNYMFEVENAHFKAEIFCRAHPHDYLRLAFLNDIKRKYFQYDKRDPDYIVYNPEVVLLVVLWSTLCGNTTCEQHSDFWFNYNPLLQLIIPGMPEPTNMISAETIRFFLKMIPDDEFSKIFQSYFADSRIKAEELLQNLNPEDSNDDAHVDTIEGFRDLIGGDGQELRASFRRGEHSRKKKGAHRVSLYNCTSRVVSDYVMVQKKNNEVQAFMLMLLRTAYPKDAIFYADAINTKEEFIAFMNERGIDWMLCIKENAGNKAFRNFIKEHFDSLDVIECFSHQTVDKVGGRIEIKDYEIIPIEKLTLPEEVKVQPGTKMVARVTSTTIEHRKDDKKNEIEPETSVSTLFYISSLDYNDENCLQLIHSHNDRWLYESHHNTIDTVLLQDQQHCCDENHLASIIGLNSMAYNILSFARQDLSKHTGVKHRNKETAKRAKLKSYNNVVSTFKGNPLLALDYLFKFLETPPVES